MKVPRINVGVEVIYSPMAAYPLTNGTVLEVNYIDKVFWIRGCPIRWPFSVYQPTPTMNNFLRAITEWDYHYRASDDPRRYEEGREQEQALIALLKALPAVDQHQLRKIVEIVVISNT